MSTIRPPLPSQADSRQAPVLAAAQFGGTLFVVPDSVTVIYDFSRYAPFFQGPASKLIKIAPNGTPQRDYPTCAFAICEKPVP